MTLSLYAFLMALYLQQESNTSPVFIYMSMAFVGTASVLVILGH